MAAIWSPAILPVVGLLFDMAGVYLLTFDTQETIDKLTPGLAKRSGGDLAEVKAEQKKGWSSVAVGLGLIILGFFLQFIKALIDWL